MYFNLEVYSLTRDKYIFVFILSYFEKGYNNLYIFALFYLSLYHLYVT